MISMREHKTMKNKLAFKWEDFIDSNLLINDKQPITIIIPDNISEDELIEIVHHYTAYGWNVRIKGNVFIFSY